MKIIIKPNQKVSFKVLFSELKQYKDLLILLVFRDIKVVYKQTILGFLWALIQPLFYMLVFTLVFSKMANVPSDGIPYPIFSYAALVPWTYFSQSLTSSTNSLISNMGIYTKVYFPRIIIPLVPVLAKLVDFCISFSILILLMFYYQIIPSLKLIIIPFLLIVMILTSAGIGIWLSGLAIRYRDIKFTVTFLVQLLMYVAPVVWPASIIMEKFGKSVYLLYGIYPMSGVIEGFRAAIIGKNEIPTELILISTISSIIIFVTGVMFFRNLEKTIVDVA